MSNSDVAKALAQFADAIAEYGHLPTLRSASWYEEGSAYLRVQASYTDKFRELRGVQVWADTFSAYIELTRDQDDSSNLQVKVGFEMAGHPASIMASLYGDQAQALIESVPNSWPEDQASLVISPAELLSTLEAVQGSEGRREWLARYETNYAASKAHDAADVDATRYAARKTEEELGPIPGAKPMAGES